MTQDRFLRIREVLSITGLSRASLYVMVKNDSFPAPVRLGARSVAWRASHVQAWMDTRPEATQANWK